MRNGNTTVQVKILGVKVFDLARRSVSAKWLSRKEIGARAKAIREALGIDSKAEMARQLGRPKSASDITKLENGTLWDDDQKPNVRLLMDLAGLGRKELDYFREGSVDQEEAEKIIAAAWMERLAKQLRADVAASVRSRERAEAERAAQGHEDLREATNPQTPPARRRGAASGPGGRRP